MKAQAFVLIGLLLISNGCSKPDAGITSDVKAAFAADSLVRARDIDVETSDGIVTLTGVVQSQAEAMQAIDIARSTRGVVNVIDDLSVMPVPGATATSGRDNEPAAIDRPDTDPGVTAEIKVRLLADLAVSALAIDVDTTDRVVTLTGIVPTEGERDRALAIARGVEHVQRVEDKLTVRASGSH